MTLIEGYPTGRTSKQAIRAYLKAGGKITHCPSMIGVGGPAEGPRLVPPEFDQARFPQSQTHGARLATLPRAEWY